MNQKETATIRQALRLIATGETLNARRMLAQLTIATRPAAGKPRANRKYVSGRHDQHCYCSRCFPIRHQEYLDATAAMIADGRLMPGWAQAAINAQKNWNVVESKPRKTRKKTTTFAEIAESRELSDDAESIAAEGYRLTFCACGHPGVNHREEPKTGNLMECHFTDGTIGDEYRKPCACDHFHYQTDSEPISAAAGA